MSNSTSAPMVRALHVSKQVSTAEGELRILDDVSFDVFPKETVAVIGVSGSGKSTLLGLLAGLDRPSSGEIWLEGEALSALDEEARARLRGRLLGFVFQNFQLLPALSALENVMLPLELAGRARPREEAAALLDRVGLGSRLHHLPAQLSGGEQQRVALARAFAPRPRLLLADEPTGNLDQRTGARIIELLFALNAEQGTTLMLVTHDPALTGLCSRRLELEAGRLSELGTGS